MCSSDVSVCRGNLCLHVCGLESPGAVPGDLVLLRQAQLPGLLWKDSTPAALQQCPACFYRWDGNLLLLRGTVEGGVGALAIR